MNLRPPRALFQALVLIAVGVLLTQMRPRHPKAEDDIVTITLTAIPGLQYDQVRFALKPGTKVKVILRNRDDMSHNLVFTKPGARLAVVEAALKLEEKGPAMNYVPATTDVLWSIPVLAPGQATSITFTAPDHSGVYPYVCTFPGHGYYMYGAMYINANGELPALKNDGNIPPVRPGAQADAKNQTEHSAHMSAKTRNHPYDLTPPYLYRAYMENSSPASIAVHLPHGLSYCWDTDACVLRYAWEGDFVDNSGLWKGKPNAVAKVLGKVFYRSSIEQPIRTKDRENAVCNFKGYRLIDRYPEFHYTLDGMDVYELVKPREDGRGLIRTFRIPDADKNILFVFHEDDGVSYATSVGDLKENRIIIAPGQARSFQVVMTRKD